jgi:hypothetical protein
MFDGTAVRGWSKESKVIGKVRGSGFEVRGGVLGARS